jgi:hypothetical protein
MSYDEEQTRRSRVVVETPQARHETVRARRTHYQPERQGYSIGVVVAVALTAIAATAIIFLFLSNPSDGSTETNVNIRATAAAEPTPLVQTPVIVNTPMTMPTPFPTPPMTAVVPAPVVITPPPAAATTNPAATLPTANTAPPAPAPTAAPVDDATLETRINRAYGEDTELARADVDLRVVEGKVILTGSVQTEILRQRAERLAYAVKGVRSVENKILVAAATP